MMCVTLINQHTTHKTYQAPAALQAPQQPLKPREPPLVLDGTTLANLEIFQNSYDRSAKGAHARVCGRVSMPSCPPSPTNLTNPATHTHTHRLAVGAPEPLPDGLRRAQAPGHALPPLPVPRHHQRPVRLSLGLLRRYIDARIHVPCHTHTQPHHTPDQTNQPTITPPPHTHARK